MPGSMSYAAPVEALPVSLSRAFAHDREWPVLVNEYKRGEPETGLLGNSSRKRWRISKRLTPAQMDELFAFWKARQGGMKPFYFDDPIDKTRYTVRFDSGWTQTAGLARGDVDISLIEVA